MAQARFEQGEDVFKVGRIIEAALFMANKTMSFAQLAEIAKTNEEVIEKAVSNLREYFETSDRAVELVVNKAEKTVSMQVRAKWLTNVAALTDKIELHRKSMKILALIAKKGEILQSDLRKYFKGDIYEYAGELREKGYIERHKMGHSWKLKPTKKFHEEFQISITEPVKEKEDAETTTSPT